jgi:hypothetical protein
MRLATMIVGLFATWSGAQAAQQWKRIESANFEMFTTTGERRAQELLDHFERVRQFFLETTGRKIISSLPIRIVVLTSRRDWEKYRVTESAAAFFKAGITRDFIVMSSESEEILQTATHEFTHLIVRHYEADFPIWLNEGLAELYSTLRAVGDKVQVGEVLKGRALDLAQKRWLTLTELFAVDRDSPHYTEKSRAGIFYSQSWLLTHMVLLSDLLRPKSGAFLEAAGAGRSSEEAFRSVYGLTPAQVERQLRDYYGGRIYTASFPIQLAKGRGKAEAVPATPVQQATCEGLLLAFVSKKDEAMELLERLAKENPDDIDVAEAATEVAWQSAEYEKGSSFAERALELGSLNQALAWRYAQHLATRDPTSDRLAELLREAVHKDPSSLEKRLLLVNILAARQDYSGVLTEARPIKQVRPAQATRFFIAMAMAHWMTGEKEKARVDLATARKHAQEPRARSDCDSVAQYFDHQEQIERAKQELEEMARQRAQARTQPVPTTVEPAGKVETVILRDPPTVPKAAESAELEAARGSLAALQCTGKTSVLILKAESGSFLRLLIDDPKKVTVVGASFDFTCGAQKPMNVEVEYYGAPNVSENGVLRVLRFAK